MPLESRVHILCLCPSCTVCFAISLPHFICHFLKFINFFNIISTSINYFNPLKKLFWEFLRIFSEDDKKTFLWDGKEVFEVRILAPCVILSGAKNPDKRSPTQGLPPPWGGGRLPRHSERSRPSARIRSRRVARARSAKLGSRRTQSAPSHPQTTPSAFHTGNFPINLSKSSSFDKNNLIFVHL